MLVEDDLLTTIFPFKLLESLHCRIKVQAAIERKSMAQWLSEAAEERLERKQKEAE
jgi:predicted HicB family RNase H-like nuclease